MTKEEIEERIKIFEEQIMKATQLKMKSMFKGSNSLKKSMRRSKKSGERQNENDNGQPFNLEESNPFSPDSNKEVTPGGGLETPGEPQEEAVDAGTPENFHSRDNILPKN